MGVELCYLCKNKYLYSKGDGIMKVITIKCPKFLSKIITFFMRKNKKEKK
ncbi:hypothetical protein H477_1015 [[Clostridium] sordellii ATCC 9714]|nr:hypothetical protein H477_1015 [[Clostridium] sordellii ATCC 9714] [Paeniclostridium sordellii ATCC 9714]